MADTLHLPGMWPTSIYDPDDVKPLLHPEHPLTYKAYANCVLTIGRRLGVPYHVVSSVFQLCGRWQLSGDACELLVDDHIHEEGPSSSQPFPAASEAAELPSSAHLCAHLSREDAATFIESSSSSGTAVGVHRLSFRYAECAVDQAGFLTRRGLLHYPLDCLHCLQSAIADGRGRRRSSSSASPSPPVVVQPTLRYGSSSTQETIMEHWKRNEARLHALLQRLERDEEEEEEEEVDDAAEGTDHQHSHCDPHRGLLHPLSGTSLLSLVEDAEDQSQFESWLEEEAEEAQRHSCFVCLAGTPSCVAGVAFCVACQLAAPPANFHLRRRPEEEEEGATVLTEGSESSSAALQVSPSTFLPDEWVAAEAPSMVLARVLLIYHCMKETFPSWFAKGGGLGGGHPASGAPGPHSPSSTLSLPLPLNSDLPPDAPHTPFLFLATPQIFEGDEDDGDTPSPYAALTAAFEEDVEVVSALVALPQASIMTLRPPSQHHLGGGGGGMDGDDWVGPPLLHLYSTTESLPSSSSLYTVGAEDHIGILVRFPSLNVLRDRLKLIPSVPNGEPTPVNYPFPTLLSHRCVYDMESCVWVEAVVLHADHCTPPHWERCISLDSTAAPSPNPYTSSISDKDDFFATATASSSMSPPLHPYSTEAINLELLLGVQALGCAIHDVLHNDDDTSSNHSGHVE